MNTSLRSFSRLLAASTLLIAVFLAPRAVAQDSLREVVQKILAFPHGFERLSEADRKLLAQVTSAPVPYLPILAEMARLPAEDAALSDPAFRLRHERLILLLVRIANEDAARILHDAYVATGKRGESFKPDATSPARNFLISTRRLLIDALGSLGDKRLARDCVLRLETEDYATRLVMLKYLRETGRGDRTIQNSLQGMLDNKSSPLYQDRTVRDTVLNISRPD